MTNRTTMSRLRGVFGLGMVALAILCGSATPALAEPASQRLTAVAYADPSRWLCLPGRSDVCARDLTVRRINADGTATPEPLAGPSTDADVDCFYVYPTVDLSLVPGNPDRVNGDRTAIEKVAESQVLPFRRTCRIFAPLYRQATIGAYALPEDIRRMFIEVGGADVLAAFDAYLAHWNQGRKIVFIGHSQGSEVLIDLMKARLDADRAARDKLSIALLTGIPSFVPLGRTTGGTFSTIPVCTQAYETGCFISFASWEEGSNPTDDSRLPTPAGQERVCVNPAVLDDASLSAEARRTMRRSFTETYLPPYSYMSANLRNDTRTSTFTRLRSTYSGACTSTNKGYRFFSIREEVPRSDKRYGMVRLASNTTLPEVLLNPFGYLIGALVNVGLHVVDMQFPMEDMVTLVETRAHRQAADAPRDTASQAAP